MATPVGYKHGLIRSFVSSRYHAVVQGKQTIIQPVSQQPCSEQRWRKAYIEAQSMVGGTIHGRYRAGLVDLFLNNDGEETPGLRQYLTSFGAIVSVYQPPNTGGDLRPMDVAADATRLRQCMAALFGSEQSQTLLGRCKDTLRKLIEAAYPNACHAIISDARSSTSFLLVVIIRQSTFDDFLVLLTTGEPAEIIALGTKYPVLGMYEKASVDEPGEVEFYCASQSKVVNFFSEDGMYTEVKVLDVVAEEEKERKAVEVREKRKLKQARHKAKRAAAKDIAE